MRSPAVISIVLAICTSTCAPAADAIRTEAFDSAGTSISYLVAGAGEPVVLIHGLHSSAKINWQLTGTMDLLADRYQVIALDVRGHGQSGKPTDDDAYGLEIVEDVARLMDHLKIKQAHIVGYSMGGMVAMKFMTAHPGRVLSGTLGGMGWLREGSALQNFWEKIPSRDGGRTPSACVHSLGKLAVNQDDVKSIDVPVAVLVGDRDPVRRLYVTALSRIRDDWPVIEIDDAGHLNCVVKEQFKDELCKWLDKNAKKQHP
jgi:pimeloyl-ACP methyl ester carboxylesterase